MTVHVEMKHCIMSFGNLNFYDMRMHACDHVVTRSQEQAMRYIMLHFMDQLIYLHAILWLGTAVRVVMRCSP